MLKPKMENFVLALLRIGWADQETNVVIAYREFLVNLVTAQGYYTKPVMKVNKCSEYLLMINYSSNRVNFLHSNDKKNHMFIDVDKQFGRHY